MSNESQNTDKAIKVAEKIIDLASESPELSEAGRRAAKSVLTIAKAVDNCLLPIAAVNFAFDKAKKYFENRFRKDLEEVTSNIPTEDLVEPKASVAAPVLQGLAFSHEEQNLKMMYLKLLSSAMDGRKAGSVHPAYAEIIRQLTSDEAYLLNQIIDGRPRIPIVTLRGRDQIGITKIHKNILPYSDTNTKEQIAAPKLPSMIDNCQRLGLISITYELHLVAKGEYDWVQSRPEYIELKEETEKEVGIEKGIMELTAFGNLFAQAVGRKPKL